LRGEGEETFPELVTACDAGGDGAGVAGVTYRGEQGGEGIMSPPFRVERKGALWWKIRDHRNHFESIRTCFIKACR